jgi:PAS domain S-box-containing protein
MRIEQLGVKDHYPDYLNRKIRLTNLTSLLLMFGVATPFVFINYIYFPPLLFIPICGLGVCVGILLANFVGLHTLSRAIISLLPFSLAMLEGSYLSQAGQMFVPSVALIIFSFFTIVFLVFDPREWGYQLGLGLLQAGGLLSIDWLNAQLEMPLDTAVIETGYLAKVATLLSVLVASGSLWTLVRLNQAAEQKAGLLLAEAQTANQALLQKDQQVGESLRQLQVAQQEEQQRRWAADCLAQCSDLTRQHAHDPEALLYEALRLLIGQVKANQGALFVAEADGAGVALVQKATYAYGRRKHAQARIQPGEGLLGQAYLEGEATFFAQVPAGYVRITSGLGEAPPNNLALAPLKNGTSTLGVLELAAFHVWASHERALIEQVGAMLGAALAAAQGTAQTRRLLAESQQLAENLRSQEEEMRQNYEELQATQEELARRASVEQADQQLRQGVIDHLPQAVFWKDAQNLAFLGANQLFADLAGVTVAQLIGKTDFDCPWPREQAEAFRADDRAVMASGRPKTVEETNTDAKGVTRWFRTTKVPIKDGQGQTVAILGTILDITEQKQREEALERLKNGGNLNQ